MFDRYVKWLPKLSPLPSINPTLIQIAKKIFWGIIINKILLVTQNFNNFILNKMKHYAVGFITLVIYIL